MISALGKVIKADSNISRIDAFLVAKYAGVTKQTKVVESLHPEWNQNIKLGCLLPNQSKAINIELWDYDLLSRKLLLLPNQ